MSNRLGLWAIGIAVVLMAEGVRANDRVSQLDPPVVAKHRLAQTNSPTQITGVSLNPTGDGVEVILTTATGTLPIPQLTTDGNRTIAEIPNAILADGKPFQTEKPIDGINTVTVEQLPGNRVKVVILGQTAAPTTTIKSDRDRLTFSASPLRIQDADLEITVTGNRINNYRVPNASVTRTSAPIIDTPGSVQVIPRKVFKFAKKSPAIGMAILHGDGVLLISIAIAVKF
jgi:iron complex outermembrane recepter protein